MEGAARRPRNASGIERLAPTCQPEVARGDRHAHPKGSEQRFFGRGMGIIPVASRKALEKERVANSDNYQAPRVSAVERGRLNEGAELMKRTASYEVWRGTLQFDAYTDLPVYFRMGSIRCVVAELVCSVLGRAVGLTIPRPFLLDVSRTTLPESHFWLDDENERVTFACAAVSDSSTFSQLIQQDSEYAKELLRKWSHYPLTVIFDEWVANLDRNQSNILFSANVIWLIDHAEALGGILSEIHPLSELRADAFANALLDRHLPDFSDQDRAALIGIANELMQFVAQIDLDTAVGCAAVPLVASQEAANDVHGFLKSRLENTVPLLCRRVGMPQIDLNHE